MGPGATLSLGPGSSFPNQSQTREPLRPSQPPCPRLSGVCLAAHHPDLCAEKGAGLREGKKSSSRPQPRPRALSASLLPLSTPGCGTGTAAPLALSGLGPGSGPAAFALTWDLAWLQL